MPPGGFHFNINGLLVCEPYFISNNILALAACLFYFPTTMILMYCYGTIFHSAKVKMRYKRAILTALPFVRGENATHKVAEQVNLFSQILKMLSRVSKNHDSYSVKVKMHYTGMAIEGCKGCNCTP